MSEESREPKRARRRTFLVDRSFQLKYTMIIVLVGVIVSALLGYFIHRLTVENRELLGIDAAMLGEVAKADSTKMLYLIGFVVLMAVFLFVWGIFITHKVAGPIFIISRYLRELREGKAPHTRPLRRGDELRDFFEAFSAAVASLRQRHLDEAAALEQVAGNLEKKGDAGLAEDVQRLRALAQSKKDWGQRQ